MSDDGPVLVQEQDTENYGLCYPDEGVIETHHGGERVELDVDSLSGKHWHEADEEELQASIEAEIEDVREELTELRSEGLTDEQVQELDRLEARIERQKNILELAMEAHGA